VGSQEVSKPVMIAVIAVVVILIGLAGWYYMRPKAEAGGSTPPGMGGQMIPGRGPGQGSPPGPPR
jgi:uncharacterized membrane protein